MNIFVAQVRAGLRRRPGNAALVAITVLLASAAMAAGFAIRVTLSDGIGRSYASALPPQVIMATGERTNEALTVLRADPRVLAAEPRRVLRGRVGSRGGGWVSLRLVVLPAFSEQQVSRVVVIGGEPRGFAVERSSLGVWGGTVGDDMVARFSGGVHLTLPTSSTAADGAVAPGFQDRIVYTYATPDAAGRVGLPADLNEVHVRIGGSPEEMRSIIDDLVRQLADERIIPTRVERVLQRHPHADQMAAVLVLVTVFAAASLAVGCALTTNLAAATMRRDRAQIGVARAIGATRARLSATATAGFLAVGAPASAGGVVLGAVLAGRFTEWAARDLNLVEYDPSPGAALWITAGLVAAGIPALFTGIVAWRAASVRPLDAILSNRNRPPTRPSSRLRDRPLWAWVSRSTLTRPVRFALTLLALTAGGAALLTAGHVHESLTAAVGRVFDARHDDADVRLLVPIPEEQLRRAVDDAGAPDSEVWGGLLVAVADPESVQTSTRFGLLTPPPDTRLLSLPIAEGRWLGDPSTPEVVASRNLLARHPSLRVGETVVLDHRGTRAAATIVGAIEEATEPGVYATRTVHDALAGRPGLAGAVRVVADGDAAQRSADIENALFRAGAVPAIAFERAELKRATEDHFVILLILLGTGATAALVIGGLGLGASVAASMIERRREIAVVRAIGASDGRVFALFLAESMVIVGLAFALAFILSGPTSAGMTRMLGAHALHISVPVRFSGAAIGVWAIVSAVVGLVSTYVPVARTLDRPPAAVVSGS